MKKAILLPLAISASLFSSSTFASQDCELVRLGFLKWEYQCSSPTVPGNSTSVPEIDGAGAGIAFALVGGLVLAYHERRLSKKSK